jgi:hypothetical protein
MRPAVRRVLTQLVPGVDRFGLVLGLLVLSYFDLKNSVGTGSGAFGGGPA